MKSQTKLEEEIKGIKEELNSIENITAFIFAGVAALLVLLIIGFATGSIFPDNPQPSPQKICHNESRIYEYYGHNPSPSGEDWNTTYDDGSSTICKGWTCKGKFYYNKEICE
jgi:hypothetical protein